MKPNNGKTNLLEGRYQLVCVECNSVNNECETTSYCTKCSGVLNLNYFDALPELQLPFKTKIQPDKLRTRETEVRKCDKLSRLLNVQLHAKLENLNPTGSFKDRGSYVEIVKALEMGKTAICLASTGNMAASVSAYASYYGLDCYVFVPENTNKGKLAQSIIHGAKIISVPGSYSECEKIAMEYSKKMDCFLAGDYVFRAEGQKTFSYELLNDSYTTKYDYVVVPVGCGTNLSAIWKGFRELFDSGLLKQLPKMVAVQPKGSSPLVKGIKKGQKIVTRKVNTKAQAVAVGNPIDFTKVKMALIESGGFATTVSDKEMLDALSLQARQEGVFSEASGALPLATVIKHKDLFKNKNVLLVITGNGLKDTDTVTDSFQNTDYQVVDLNRNINKRNMLKAS